MKKKVLLESKTNANLLESYKPIANNSSVIGSFKVKGMIAEDTISKNRTKYPKGAWLSEGALARGGRFIDSSGKLTPSKLMGSLDHPDDGHVEMKLKEACVMWNNIQRNPDGTWDGEAHILNNEHGKALKTILDYVKEFGGGDMIGVSSRSVGNVEQKTDGFGNYYESVIPGTLELKSFDVVYEPSFSGAQILQESTKALGKQKVLFESIKALGEEDEEHKEYYNNLAKDLENKFSKEGEGMKKGKKLKEASRIEELTKELEETATKENEDNKDKLVDIPDDLVDDKPEESEEDGKKDTKTGDEVNDEANDEEKTLEAKVDEILEIVLAQDEEIASLRNLVEDLTANFDFNDIDEIGEDEEDLEGAGNLEDQPDEGDSDDDIEGEEDLNDLELTEEELELLSDEELDELLAAMGE